MKLSHILLITAALALAGCHKADNDELDHHHGSEAEEAEEHADHDHDHAGAIHLEPEMAAKLGVTVDTVAVAQMGTSTRVSGIIEASADALGTASAPTAGIVTLAGGISAGSEVKAGQLIATVRAEGVSGGDANRAARAALEAARAELERIKPLWEERLVTRAQYTEAVAAYERTKAEYSAPAASGRVVAPLSGVITSLDVSRGQYVDAGATVATISGAGALNLRADVPARQYASLGSVTDARIVLPYGDGNRAISVSELGGRRSSASPAAASGGYVPVTFRLTSSELIPGTAVDVYLIGQGSRQALSVPATAIVEQQGQYFVYERLHDDLYTKIPVKIGATDGVRREIVAGLKGGEVIVSTGTTAVTLAAAAGNVPEGHSHSH